MFASLRRTPVTLVCALVAGLTVVAWLGSCAADVPHASPPPSSTAAQDRPPDWVSSYVSRVNEQYGQADLIEWVWVAREPEAKDLNGDVLVGLQLVDRGAEEIGGSTLFVDYPAGTPVRSLGYYIVAAQGDFTARPEHDAPPVPGKTVLLQLAAVSIAGHLTFRTAQVGLYGESVHLDLDGTRVYCERAGPEDFPVDWLQSPR